MKIKDLIQELLKCNLNDDVILMDDSGKFYSFDFNNHLRIDDLTIIKINMELEH